MDIGPRNTAALGPEAWRQNRDFFVNGGILQPALRQLQVRFRDPVTLASLAGIGLVMGVSGPFDTFAALDLPQRLAYWGVVVPLSYAAGLSGSAVAEPFLQRRHKALRIAVVSLASCLAVWLVLLGLNMALGFVRFDPVALLGSFAAVYVICLSIESLGEVLAARPSPTATPAQSMAPPILSRLPLEKRGALIRLAVQDHYVEVVTAKGREMLLMRLADAITECAPIAGFQTHRSHWVALSQVVRARRHGESYVLILHSGIEIPLARARIKAAQAAGILPKPGGPAPALAVKSADS